MKQCNCSEQFLENKRLERPEMIDSKYYKGPSHFHLHNCAYTRNRNGLIREAMDNVCGGRNPNHVQYFTRRFSEEMDRLYKQSLTPKISVG